MSITINSTNLTLINLNLYLLIYYNFTIFIIKIKYLTKLNIYIFLNN